MNEDQLKGVGEKVKGKINEGVGKGLVRHNDTPVLYQEGKLENLLPVGQLLKSIYEVEEVPRGTAVFCGTKTVIGKLEPARLFEMELFDPVLGRSLRHKYEVHELEN